jgi:hypothetical protein
VEIHIRCGARELGADCLCPGRTEAIMCLRERSAPVQAVLRGPRYAGAPRSLIVSEPTAEPEPPWDST